MKREMVDPNGRRDHGQTTKAGKQPGGGCGEAKTIINVVQPVGSSWRAYEQKEITKPPMSCM